MKMIPNCNVLIHIALYYLLKPKIHDQGFHLSMYNHDN